MPDIRIHRKHTLGLAKARKVAWAWAEDVEQKFDMECTVLEGDTSDTVEFKRSGVNGLRSSPTAGERRSASSRAQVAPAVTNAKRRASVGCSLSRRP